MTADEFRAYTLAAATDAKLLDLAARVTEDDVPTILLSEDRLRILAGGVLRLLRERSELRASLDVTRKLTDETTAELTRRAAGLEAEAELYRRGYAAIGACDISHYLALCETAGGLGEVVLVGRESAQQAERERCAAVARHRAEHHRDHCPATCRCADGWHIAAAIEGKT